MIYAALIYAQSLIRVHIRVARRPRLALVLLGLLLPMAQPAHAVDVYYARAIGQEYAPDEAPPTPRNDAPESAADELPALGGPAGEPRPREMGFWSKLLIGVVLVAAVTALGDGDGGSAQMNVAPGTAPDPAPANTSPAPENGGASGGGDSGGAGGGNGAPGTAQDSGGGAGANQGPAETADPDANGGSPPVAAPGGGNGGGFDIEVGENRVRVDIGDERFEFGRGGERDDNGRGRGRGRGRGGDD